MTFNCFLTMLAESWSLKGMTTRVTSFPTNLPQACNGWWLLVSNSRVDKGIDGGVDKLVRVVQT